MCKIANFIILLQIFLWCTVGHARYVVTKNNDYAAIDNLTIVSRAEWCALPPKATEEMTNPVPFVVIHHSASPPACNTKIECIAAMRSMQIYHQETNGWYDIGYSFAVGGDFRAYEGRGWSYIGAHAPTFNNKSIGICIIGDWREELPPREQLNVVKQLIDYGVEIGKISENYQLVGHRQVKNSTECPGESLFQEIKNWEHYKDYPDLVHVDYNPKVQQKNKYLTVNEANEVLRKISAGVPKCELSVVTNKNFVQLQQ